MAEQTFTSGQILTAAQMTTLQTNIGLNLVSTTTVGTAVSSVTVSSAFNSTYDSYRIIYDGGVSSTSTGLELVLGASVANYNMSLPNVTYGTAVASGTSLSAAAAWSLIGYATTNYAGMSIDLYSPNLARYTRVAGSYIDETAAGPYVGIHKVATAYTAFTLSPTTGTLTGGTISVYCYRK